MLINPVSITFNAINTLAGILDSIRKQTPMPASVNLQLKQNIYYVTAILAPAIEYPADIGAIAQVLIDSIAVLRKSSTPNDVSKDLYAAAIAAAGAVPSYSSPALQIASSVADALAASCTAGYLAQAFVAEAKSNFTDQQSAFDALNRISSAMDSNTDYVAQNAGGDVFEVLRNVSMLSSSHISDVQTNLKPIVSVQSQYSAPSSALGWSLYSDPSQALDLVNRNQCLTPIFMPTTFQALSPS